MLFNSYIFFVFLLVFLPVYYVLKGTPRKLFMLAASYFFYGYWDYRFVGLLLVTTTADFIIGHAIQRSDDERHRKRLFILSLCISLGILGFFKYFNFFIDSFITAFAFTGITLDFVHLHLILPVGISFYTFQSISFIFEVYRKKMRAPDRYIDYALYLAFFPQHIAGPIERASHLIPQITVMKNATRTQWKEGFSLITIGMFKKVMLGDTSGKIVDQIFADPSRYTSFELLCGLILFSVQIYVDFSGYSNIARGCAKFIGVDIILNFNQPYFSRSITEFWRRWHISLSSWLRDYLYISLGGNRRSEFRTYMNLMVTMLIGGLWHGASWNFVIWGGLHGTYLMVHKFMLGKGGEKKEGTPEPFLTGVLNVFATYLLVLVTWLLFRAKDFETVMLFVQKFIQWETGEYALRFTMITGTFLLAMIGVDLAEIRTKRHDFLLVLPLPVQAGIAAVVWFFVLLYMLQHAPMPFIYFQF